MLKKKLSIFVITVLITSILLTGCNQSKSVLDKNNPTTVTVWHYYNGKQQSIFDGLVKEFNETVGAEKGIVVEARNQGDINSLVAKVKDSANAVAGADEMPDVFSAYADTAFEINKMDLVVDISKYLTQEEQAEYIGSFLDEGRFDSDDSIKIFPVAKSTEIFMLNETDWEPFQQATNVSESDLKTWEGITETARKYYEWTNSQTITPNDGKAFFGRDSYANYMIVGSLQLGVELFNVVDGEVSYQIDKQVMRKLWDNFYVPYVNGWFASYGKFRSDDAKTGVIIALVGSTSGATYFPNEVTREDGTTYPINAKIFKLPNFEGTEPYAVQQGAGMVVIKSDEKKETASIEFLKWFTMTDNNIEFSASSGYLPVKIESNNVDTFKKTLDGKNIIPNDLIGETISVGSQMTKDYVLYTNKAFRSGYDARRVVEFTLIDMVNADLEQINSIVDTGVSREEAASQFTTDEHFEEWFAGFTSKLQSVK